MEIQPLNERYYKQINEYILTNWGKPIVTRGNIVKEENLSGFVAFDENMLIGAILYQIIDLECEIVVLYSLKENSGVGTRLINAVINAAKLKNCQRVWLITMNDNTHAIRYYQKRGFSLKAVHINAFEETRKIKGISENILGIDDIPVLHEFEFEMIL
ncbi:MAG: GNAT family N-acetyltransferase [Lachnospiraceae bacterium]|nr:GNAT family N-acetyltransferase [Lachnospiraceae bacterium]